MKNLYPILLQMKAYEISGHSPEIRSHEEE